MADKPYLNASAVAAAIGANPFQSPDAAFYNVLCYSRTWKYVIEELKAAKAARTDREVFADACEAAPAITEAVAAGVAAATAASSDEGVRAAIDAAVSASVAALDAGDAKHAAHADVIASAVAQAVRTERGAALEARVLDEYEAAVARPITQRNTSLTYLRTRDYTIGGRLDGYDAAANAVVEVKTRRRVWPKVPPYDVVQLRVYLAMLAATHPGVKGVLVERFPDGSERKTEIAHDEHEWAAIDAAINEHVVARFRTLTRADVEALVDAVCIA